MSFHCFLYFKYRKSLKKFLYSVREKNGAFRMHVDGETDIRGVYCAVSVAKLANYSAQDEFFLFDKTIDWIVSCQSYEGGIGGAPDLEAHGGYTFCGIAALALLGSIGNCNLKALMVRRAAFFIKILTYFHCLIYFSSDGLLIDK